MKEYRGKKIVEAMRDNTTPERFSIVKDEGENHPKHENGDDSGPRECVQQNPTRQVDTQEQQR